MTLKIDELIAELDGLIEEVIMMECDEKESNAEAQQWLERKAQHRFTQAEVEAWD